jgi:hypothetical protein
MIKAMDLYQMEALPNSQTFAFLCVQRGWQRNRCQKQSVFRAGKINIEGELYLARTDDQKIKTSDDKILCPDGIFFSGFPQKRKMTNRKNTVPRGNLILYETLKNIIPYVFTNCFYKINDESFNE